MAPDNNSITPAPRSRSATATMPAMPATLAPSSPLSRLNEVPTSPLQRSPGSPPLGSAENGITSTAQGPLRHPKPLTPSDLHLVLEKEQEAMVNRLTRELSLLRQQTASVASTTSSASTLNEPTSAEGVQNSPPLGRSSSRPNSSRRHRSSSSIGSNAQVAQSAMAANVAGIAPWRENNPHASSRNHSDLPRRARSREPSLTMSRRPSVSSLTSFPQYQHNNDHHTPYYGNSPSIYPYRNSISQPQSAAPASNPMARYEEAAYHKSELDVVKRENDQLRKRVRELETTLKRVQGA
ncbi:hypothetical protein N7510_009964 [Penicillium lagena]|uniref:uncharacterized protein n=1 Tax=Penicillium lagena TaxID=94218 RepID=UPI002540B493|nr:uncharacterized protein N7510_009964 [Penicillium lagena]KAJ5604810.1 hypothetical protein N7510_009964 [Penicillium lagena]